MAEAISVAVRRGSIVEAVHRVHAVAVRDGEVVAEAGDSELVSFMRSAAKPMQALPLARDYPDLTGEELAIASASHLADPDQLRAVALLLARADAREEELECGLAGEPPRRINHNCSGKHAGMIAVCRARGWPVEGYRLPGHPLQAAILDDMREAAGVDELVTATDGCGVPTFALLLRQTAAAFTRLESLPGGERVAAAMRAHPGMIRGDRAADTELMRALPGWTAKGGAEGLIAAVSGDGLGVALKVEDGATRALRPALAVFLSSLGERLPEGFGHVPAHNSRGEEVGEIVAL